jgi:hypothetical protein
MLTDEISRRTPDLHTRFNTADRIEKGLQTDGHQSWGFVIYRCTYESDDNWDSFMERLKCGARKTLEFYNGLDLLDSFKFTVLSDREQFDGASTSAIRDHFKQWCSTAIREEQGLEPTFGPWGTQAQRYRYCVFVDDESMESFLEEESAPDAKGVTWEPDRFVTLIKKDWEPGDEEAEKGRNLDPIEGCILEDVGWMMVEPEGVLVGIYDRLRDWNNWHVEYRRPPQVAIL